MENLSSFGDLLKTFRQRQCLTQQELAELMGVHRNTIGIWERGNYLPESKTLVLELAHQLDLQEQETRQLLEASLTALPPHWSVPLPRNLYFTGREQVLETLHSQLSVERALALTQSSALHGLGGVGKTQIALEYAYRYGLEYSAVFWLGAETQEELLAGLVRVASVLQLPEREDKDQQRVVEAVQHWLSTVGQWLLILDNLEELDVLDRFLPAVRQGAVLLTTRLQTLGTRARGLDLWPMEQEEGTLFLLRRAKVLAAEATNEEMRGLAEQMPEQYAAAVELVELMRGLPLALDQAGAYLEATRCGLPAYLERFRTQQAALLKLRGEGVREHPASVSTTFRLALAATTRRHPAVGDLLRVCALVQSEAIPEELFRQAGEYLGPQLQVACRDPLEWDRLVGVACSYSLLSRQPAEQTLSPHRLVQAILLDGMTETEREQWITRTIRAFDAMFPEILPETKYAAWKQCERLLPHVMLCLHRSRVIEQSLTLASLAYKAAQYLRERGRYTEAEPLYQRALHLREQVLGREHPDVAASLQSLASLYYLQGKVAEAEPLCQRALRLREQVLGPEHLDVAASLQSLANLYFLQAKYIEAEPLYQRALHLREQALGSNGPQVAQVLVGLAELYLHQYNYGEAEPLYRRALRIWEHVLSPDHPLVAYPLNGLAILLREQGRYAEAAPLLQRALHIREQALGANHPQVAQVLTNLAILFQRQGNNAEAEPLFRRALHIREQALGANHPQLAYPLHGLAILFQQQGNNAEAELLFQRALSIREQKLGQRHPETAITLHDLALLRQKQGQLSEALSLAQRALSIRSQSLGNAHPKTVATRALYDQLLQEQESAQVEAASAHCPEAIPDPRRNERLENGASLPLHEADHPSSFENSSAQEFLDTCCELHPLAWCPISELWHTYEHWSATSRKRIPVSRRAFAEQVKARGCRVDRTSTARIWRGIRLVNKHL